MTTLLPPIRVVGDHACSNQGQYHRQTLFIAEGFEDRCESWVKSLPQLKQFERVVLFDNNPVRRSRREELLNELKKRSKLIEYGTFYRFDPTRNEELILSKIRDIVRESDEVVIDISVMSKLLIVMLIFSLRDFSGRVRIVYTEPDTYAPTELEYAKYKAEFPEFSDATTFPSLGVHNVERLASLSSTIMQGAPSVVATFTSFNENLIRAFLSLSPPPSRLYIVNGRPPSLCWREIATFEIHKSLYIEYAEDNLTAAGFPQHVCSTLDYRETFYFLAARYMETCYTHRMVLVPTGSKMQAVGCALFKAICHDVHIEYPTPESFYTTGLSSGAARYHEIIFDCLPHLLPEIANSFGLNG